MAVVRTLYQSSILRMGEFHCPRGDHRWRTFNSIGEGHHLVFPRTAVFIAHEGGDAVLADPSVAVVYRSQERYRRVIADPAGDHCVWVVPSFELAPTLEVLDGGRPAARFVRTGRRAYAAQGLIARALAGGGPIDPLVVEEEMQAVVVDALRRVAETPPPRARIASGDEAVDGSRDDIGRVAAAVGYSSHSHFCTSFRRAFGVPPSRLRRWTEPDLRKNLKAIATHQP